MSETPPGIGDAQADIPPPKEGNWGRITELYNSITAHLEKRFPTQVDNHGNRIPRIFKDMLSDGTYVLFDDQLSWGNKDYPDGHNAKFGDLDSAAQKRLLSRPTFRAKFSNADGKETGELMSCYPDDLEEGGINKAYIDGIIDSAPAEVKKIYAQGAAERPVFTYSDRETKEKKVLTPDDPIVGKLYDIVKPSTPVVPPPPAAS